MAALTSYSWIIYALVCLSLLITASGDAFNTADSNGDSSISRDEFAAYTSKLRGSMSAFLDTAPSENGQDVVSTPATGGDFMPATFNALVMILVTEIGDKTFFIAAVLAMRHGRLVVYAGAMIALAVMHVLSCIMGYALPTLLPVLYTHYASIGLFAYFGYRLLADAMSMGSGPSEELQEVEQELISKKDDEGGDVAVKDVEEGGVNGKEKDNNINFGLSSSQLKVFSQAFMLTFLAEWGDRSQIATIALAAAKNVYGVMVGGLIGHAFCTGLAVLGGRMLAARISERTVAYVGGILFFVFALHSVIVGPPTP